MTSQFFHEIVIFPLTNVPDECRTTVIVKESIVLHRLLMFSFMVGIIRILRTSNGFIPGCTSGKNKSKKPNFNPSRDRNKTHTFKTTQRKGALLYQILPIFQMHVNLTQHSKQFSFPDHFNQLTYKRMIQRIGETFHIADMMKIKTRGLSESISITLLTFV